MPFADNRLSDSELAAVFLSFGSSRLRPFHREPGLFLQTDCATESDCSQPHGLLWESPVVYRMPGWRRNRWQGSTMAVSSP